MDRLDQELRRLYFLPGQAAHGASLDGDAPTTRVMVLEFSRAADWGSVAALLGEIRDALTLPLPAVSIAARGGYQLWFSLAQPVPVEAAGTFLDEMCRQFLGDLAPGSWTAWPEAAAAGAGAPPALPPREDVGMGKWSAFIEPSLGAMFVDEPGLAMAPSGERQADLLATIASIAPEDFWRVSAVLDKAPAVAGVLPTSFATPGNAAVVDRRGERFADPKQFLLSVINDPSLDVAHRIEAAKALLPYFHSPIHVIGARQSSANIETE